MQLIDLVGKYNTVVVTRAIAVNGVPTFTLTGQVVDKATLKTQIRALNEVGVVVLLAIWDVSDTMRFNNMGDAALTQMFIDWISEYEFDGFEIFPYDKNSLNIDSNFDTLKTALESVRSFYSEYGHKVIISFATFYDVLNNENSGSQNISHYLDNIPYDLVQVWTFNQYSPPCRSVHDYYPNVKGFDAERDFMSCLILGLGYGFFNFLTVPFDKLVIVLPSIDEAAYAGQFEVSPYSGPISSFQYFKGAINLKGLSGYSANYEFGVDKNGNAYTGGFTNSYKDIVLG
eukprot:GHVL01037760.1.p1 GENE.GHVL01037760.1~~GHVL01037760.1.p1  ORF type:complete len:287 (+),score=16.34 GHVL01037760.1:130-990(+)